MNKKLIKTLVSITCGLGVASAIPVIATSCGPKEDSRLNLYWTGSKESKTFNLTSNLIPKNLRTNRLKIEWEGINVLAYTDFTAKYDQTKLKDWTIYVDSQGYVCVEPTEGSKYSSVKNLSFSVEATFTMPDSKQKHVKKLGGFHLNIVHEDLNIQYETDSNTFMMGTTGTAGKDEATTGYSPDGDPVSYSKKITVLKDGAALRSNQLSWSFVDVNTDEDLKGFIYMSYSSLTSTEGIISWNDNAITGNYIFNAKCTAKINGVEYKATLGTFNLVIEGSDIDAHIDYEIETPEKTYDFDTNTPSQAPVETSYYIATEEDFVKLKINKDNLKDVAFTKESLEKRMKISYKGPADSDEFKMVYGYFEISDVDPTDYTVSLWGGFHIESNCNLKFSEPKVYTYQIAFYNSESNPISEEKQFTLTFSPVK